MSPSYLTFRAHHKPCILHIYLRTVSHHHLSLFWQRTSKIGTPPLGANQAPYVYPPWTSSVLPLLAVEHWTLCCIHSLCKSRRGTNASDDGDQSNPMSLMTISAVILIAHYISSEFWDHIHSSPSWLFSWFAPQKRSKVSVEEEKGKMYPFGV